MGRIALLDEVAIPAAGTHETDWISGLSGAAYLLLQAKLVRSSGGTSIKAYVQTSIDGGETAIDIACFAFTTTNATKISAVTATADLTDATAPTDGTLADNTTLDGVIGDMLRVKYIVVGTYVDSTITVVALAK